MNLQQLQMSNSSISPKFNYDNQNIGAYMHAYITAPPFTYIMHNL
jgi:hypothetical protein